MISDFIIGQETILGARGICSYDLDGEEAAEIDKQESATYPHKQTQVNLCGSRKIGGQRKHYMVRQP